MPESIEILDHLGNRYSVVKGDNWDQYSELKRAYMSLHPDWDGSKEYDNFIEQITKAMEG